MEKVFHYFLIILTIIIGEDQTCKRLKSSRTGTLMGRGKGSSCILYMKQRRNVCHQQPHWGNAKGTHRSFNTIIVGKFLFYF